MRRPSSLDLARVMITFNRLDSGRNLGGMLSHVLRPMTTALSVWVGDDDCEADEGGATWEVTFRKNAMSALI